MLVPLMVFVAVLLEPTHAARMLEPGACAHAQGGGRRRAVVAPRAAAGGRACTDWARGIEYLHVDARTIVGEPGGSIVPIRGANEYLGKRSSFIVVERAGVRGRVACGRHDQHLRFVKVKVRSVVCVSELSLCGWRGCGAPLRRLARDVALVRAALSQGMLSLASSDTYDMLHAFAFSSAASSVRKPPESERCTTCRQIVDMLRMHTYTRGRHRAESGHPLSDSPTCGEVYVGRDGCRLCVAWVELRSALRGALRSRSAPTCSSDGG